MGLKEAARAAICYIEDKVVGDDVGLTLEEIEWSDRARTWLVTVGVRRGAPGTGTVLGTGEDRAGTVYKLVRVRADGQVVSVENR